MASAMVDDIFANQISSRDFTKFTLGRGVTDFSQLKQFNMYEKGYPFLVVLKIPEMLNQLANQNTNYATLVNNFRHLLEYDFMGMDGLEDMQTETQEINNGVTKLDVITKVNWQGGSQFSMKFQERQGSVFTRINELYLRGIKDPRTQVKRYNGLLKTGDEKSVLEAGYENEVFQFMYFVTDNTARYIEKAFLIVSAQITGAEMSMYNQTKGQIEWQDLNLQFNGYPITGPAITAKSQKFLDWINENTVFEEMKYGYDALTNMAEPGAHGTITASSPKATW